MFKQNLNKVHLTIPTHPSHMTRLEPLCKSRSSLKPIVTSVTNLNGRCETHSAHSDTVRSIHCPIHFRIRSQNQMHPPNFACTSCWSLHVRSHTRLTRVDEISQFNLYSFLARRSHSDVANMVLTSRFTPFAPGATRHQGT